MLKRKKERKKKSKRKKENSKGVARGNSEPIYLKFQDDRLTQLVEHQATVREVAGWKPRPDQQSGSLNN